MVTWIELADYRENPVLREDFTRILINCRRRRKRQDLDRSSFPFLSHPTRSRPWALNVQPEKRLALTRWVAALSVEGRFLRSDQRVPSAL